MRYLSKKKIILFSVVALIVIAGSVVGIHSLLSNKNMDGAMSSIDVTYEKPTMNVPKSNTELYQLLDGTDSDVLDFSLSSSSDNHYIVVNCNKNDEHNIYYLSYSTTYDCTVCTKNMDEEDGEEPFKIFYNVDYEDGDELAADIVSFFINYYSSPKSNAHLVEGVDGSLTLELN